MDQVQVIGTKKCQDTNKALRFFKERSIKVHFLDLNEKGLSKGELRNISSRIPLENLIDTESKEYKNRNLQYMTFDIEDELLVHPLLIKTPIVRSGSVAILGYKPDQWKKISSKS